MDPEPSKDSSADRPSDTADGLSDEESAGETTERWDRSSKTVGFDELEKGTELASGRVDEATQVKRYVIQNKLGSGKFGDVYEAADIILDRLVAIKMTKSQDEQPDVAREEFLQEARAAASLEHPGIVAIYDADHDGPYTYIVQELVDGPDLRTYLDQNKLTTKQAAEMMIPIAEAVAFAHREGFVHRDLKPQNILIDKEGRPRVADFGLALHEEQLYQHKKQVAGTLSYMSPEQLRGDTHLLDGRSDIWSLGVILYEMLARKRPFRGDNATTLAEQILERDPKPLRQINDDIPAEYEPIVCKCLAKAITDRYSTASDLARDLKGAITPSKRLGRWKAAAALLLTLSLALIWWQPWQTPSLAPGTSATDPGAPMIESFFVTHIRDLVDHSERVGRLGIKSFSCQENDSVQVDAQFSQPTYCYLIAFNPGGSLQLCWPATPKEPPSPLRSLVYPSDAAEAFYLTEGAGMQSFVLVASIKALPSFDEWRNYLNGIPWPISKAEYVFQFDGRQVSRLTRDRGTVRKLKGSEQIEAFCNYFRAKSDGATIHVFGFPVLPK